MKQRETWPYQYHCKMEPPIKLTMSSLLAKYMLVKWFPFESKFISLAGKMVPLWIKII